MSTTATKICARVTNNPASSGRNTLGLEFITTGFGSAEETPKLSGWQGFAHPSAYAGWNRIGSRSRTLVSVFRANLDDEVVGLFGSPYSRRHSEPRQTCTQLVEASSTKLQAP